MNNARQFSTNHVQPATPSLDQADLDVSEIFRVFRRRIWVFLGVVASVLAFALVALEIVDPRYSAEALIMIESDGAPRVVSLESVVASLSGDEESVTSESYVLASRALAGRVIDLLKLDDDPEFAAEKGTSSVVARSRMVDEFLDNLSISPLEGSRVISVGYSSLDPEKAALIANTVAEQYLQSRLETKFEITARTNAWLGERIAELREDVNEAEALVERAREEYGLYQGSSSTLSSQELTELNTQLVMARTATAEAEARLGQVERIARTSSGGASATTAVLESPLIQRLREQEAQVERRVAELSSELGEKHPRLIQLRAEAADMQDRIKLEVNKIVQGLRNTVSVSRAREAALRKGLDSLKADATIASRNENSLRSLVREAEANRTLLSTLLARQKETISQEDNDFQQADATVVSKADIPAEPSFPKAGVVLGLSVIGGLVFGALTIFVLELVDGGYRSGEQFERYTGIGSIGIIPLVDKQKDYKSISGYVAGERDTVFHEAVRNVYWSLKLTSPDRVPKVLLVASSLTGEGKSTLAASLATVQSIAGQNVLLIDADVRRPSLHSEVGVEREPGLTNVLSGSVGLDDALVEKSWTRLTVLPAGMATPNAPTLLGSDKMKSLLRDLRGRFDLIVIDSPPVMAATDARILCREADVTLLVAKWGKTRRPVVQAAARYLHAAGAPTIVGLLNMVDLKANEFYGYGDSSFYGTDVSSYHST
jgi:succinoglycan biosynthesis transport protein ExoP